MRLPRKPPPFKIPLSDPQKASRVIRMVTSPELVDFSKRANHKYLHWDKIRFYDIPEDFNHYDAWWAVKFSRGSQYITLPLAYEGERQFCYWTPPRHQQWLHIIDQDAGGMIGSRSKHTVKDSDDRYLFNSLMEEAIASSQIEGASTTRAVAKEMLRTKRRPRNHAEQMIVNNYKAILEIRGLKRQKLSPKMLCHLQGILTKHTLENPASGGRFRIDEDDPICVAHEFTDEVIYTPPPPNELDDRVRELCDFANHSTGQFMHPVIKAIILHFMIGFIHPFVDGNGRTARAVFYWYMLKSGYWMFEYLPISKIVLDSPIAYTKAYLYAENDDGDLTYFLHYHLRAIDIAIKKMHTYFAREQELMHMAADALSGMDDLNYRQLSLMTEAIKGSFRTTVHQHAGTFNVTKATARADLHGLADKGLLKKKREGKRDVFSPTIGLLKKLSRGDFDETRSDFEDQKPDKFLPLPKSRQLELFE